LQRAIVLYNDCFILWEFFVSLISFLMSLFRLLWASFRELFLFNAGGGNLVFRKGCLCLSCSDFAEKC
jgi:hypothetical protein